MDERRARHLSISDPALSNSIDQDLDLTIDSVLTRLNNGDRALSKATPEKPSDSASQSYDSRPQDSLERSSRQPVSLQQDARQLDARQLDDRRYRVSLSDESASSRTAIGASLDGSGESWASAHVEIAEGSSGASADELAEIHSTLFAAYRAQMRHWCRNASQGPIGARIDTSDVVQESLIQVWRDWDRMKEKSYGEIQAWMFQIARGHLSKLRRHHLAHKRDIKRTERAEEDSADPLELDPSNAVLRAEKRLQVMIALQRLPEDLAEIVKLRLFAMCSFREIGERLQIDRAEARYRFLRAIRRLKRLLEDQESDRVRSTL